jgi:hypothetical protein
MIKRIHASKEILDLIEFLSIKNNWSVVKERDATYFRVDEKIKQINFINQNQSGNQFSRRVLQTEGTLDEVIALINGPPEPAYKSVKVPSYKFTVVGEAVHFDQIKEGRFFLKDNRVWKKEVYHYDGRTHEPQGCHLDDKNYYTCMQTMRHANNCYPLSLEIT